LLLEPVHRLEETAQFKRGLAIWGPTIPLAHSAGSLDFSNGRADALSFFPKRLEHHIERRERKNADEERFDVNQSG
jgi:hypothetical protein